VIALDPLHCGANNDLGFTLAEEGGDLARAQRLIGVAVERAPDNRAYLDSMGWVEYKRGKFDEALRYLNRAVAPAGPADPVVLDHLGDAQYRLSRRSEAAATWKRSLDRLDEIGAADPELKALGAKLRQKIAAQESGRPVDVAPIADAAPAGRAAAARPPRN
jgi:tetratricopeptide (TPR) repeat protein